jgi:hypothetical protein
VALDKEAAFVAAGQRHPDDRIDRLAAGAMVFAYGQHPAAGEVQLQIGVAQLPG